MNSQSQIWGPDEITLINNYKDKVLDQSTEHHRGMECISRNVDAFTELHGLINEVSAVKRTECAVNKKLRDTLQEEGKLLTRKQKAKRIKAQLIESSRTIDRMDEEASSRTIDRMDEEASRNTSDVNRNKSFKSGVYYIPLESMYGKVEMEEFLRMWGDSKVINS